MFDSSFFIISNSYDKEHIKFGFYMHQIQFITVTYWIIHRIPLKLSYISTNKPYSIISINLNDTHTNATTDLINTKQLNHLLTEFPCFPDDIIIFQAQIF